MESLKSFLANKIGLKESELFIRSLPTVLILSLITLLSYSYYNALSPILSMLATDFGFTNEERDYYLGSRLNTIFFVVGCPCSILFSFLADSNNRQSMFTVLSFLCHLSSFFIPFVSSYLFLCIWRGLSGALITSLLPIYLSILGDIFPPTLRSFASVIASAIVGCGMLIGQTLSGFFSVRFGWRLFFTVISVFGLVSVAFFYYSYSPTPTHSLIRELPRTNSSKNIKSPKSPKSPVNVEDFDEKDIEITLELETKKLSFDTRILKSIFNVSSNWLLFLQGIPGSIPWGVFTIYLHSILHIEKHLSVDSASLLLLVYGIGAGIGSATSGVICSYLLIFNKSLLPVAVSCFYFFSLPLLFSFFSISFPSETFTFVVQGIVLFLIGLLLSIPGPCIRTMLMNVNQPQCRSTIISISEVFNNIGKVLGPVAFVSFCKSHNRIDAMIYICEFFYIPAVLCFCLYFFYAKDEENVIKYIHGKKTELETISVKLQPKKTTTNTGMKESPSPSFYLNEQENALNNNNNNNKEKEEENANEKEKEKNTLLLSRDSLRITRDGMNQAFKKVVETTLSSVDSLISTRFSHKEEGPEIDPLITKV